MHTKNVNVTQATVTNQKNVVAAHRTEDFNEREDPQTDHNPQRSEATAQGGAVEAPAPTMDGAWMQHQVHMAPPLPPRVGGPAGRNQQAGGDEGVVPYTAYKPVPPPKPYPHNVNTAPAPTPDPGLPHVLVTDQGHFHTHSSKFPPQQPLPAHATAGGGRVASHHQSPTHRYQQNEENNTINEANMPPVRHPSVSCGMNASSGLPPEGTLAGMPPPRGYHSNSHHHTPPHLPSPPYMPASSVSPNGVVVSSPYMAVPRNGAPGLVNGGSGMSNGCNDRNIGSSHAVNGNLGIPLTTANTCGRNGNAPTLAMPRESWNGNSQPTFSNESGLSNGHQMNGHVPNGGVKKITNGHHSHIGYQNHGFTHSQDVIQALNGYNNSQGPTYQPNGQYHHTNGQHTHINGDSIRLTSIPAKNGHINGQPNGHHNGDVQHMSNGHSLPTGYSMPSEDINNANEKRQEEQRKDDRWGSLKKGLKYNHLKGIIAGKFGKTDIKEDKNKTVSSQGTNTHSKALSRETSPSKRENGGSTNIQNSSIRLPNGTFIQSPIETNLSTTTAMKEASSKIPPLNFAHGTPLRNSVVHFDVPSSQPMMHEQRGGSTRFTGNPAMENTLTRRAGSYHQLTQSDAQHQPQSQQQLMRKRQNQGQDNRFSADDLTQAIPSDHTYGTNGRTVGSAASNITAPGCPEGSNTSDSGRGTAGSGGAGGERRSGHNTSLDSGGSRQHGHSSGNDSEWVDIPDGEVHKTSKARQELRQLPVADRSTKPTPYRGSSIGLDQQHPLSQHKSFASSTHALPSAPVMGTANLGLNRGAGANNSRRSLGRRESLVTTPPLPPLSPEGSPRQSPATSPNRISAGQYQRSYSSSALNQPDLLEAADGNRGGDTKGGPRNMNSKGAVEATQRWRQEEKAIDRNKMRINLPPLLSRHSTGRLDIDPSELTETDVLDLDSMLGANTEATSDDDEDASNYDPDVNLLRKQLEGLEGMYSEVLKLLGGNNGRKLKTRRRLHGSMSSLPSSIVSNNRSKDRRRSVLDDKLRRVATNRDGGKGIQRRFQRLESHVVTLARSVAHLSSEMRSQNTLLQEMDSIRNDVAALRLGGLPQNHIANNPVRNGAINNKNWDFFNNGMGHNVTNPDRLKKLTKFFGAEPPLLRLFLQRLGYEQYVGVFEKEKIGMLELPYIDERRLENLNIPLGPRLRILREAQGPITTDGNLSVYVV